jgi:hypothetical protein
MRGASGAKLIKKRKSWKSRNAVSEIIGNILILAITVIMFSSIFIFVASMDGPSEKVYTDFTGSVVTKANGDVEAVKIINKGGQPLEDSRTVIYLFVSDVATSLRITDSTPSIGTTWNTGATWNYTGLTGVTRDAKISVMIVDVQANTVVWEATLQGSDVASTAPIIGGRGISATSSPIAGTVQVGDSIKFFAYVSSPYGAIDPGSVTVNASRLTGFGSDPIALKNDGSGVYWSVASYPASQAWNGKVITFHAADVNGQKVSANFVVKVVTGSSGPENPLDDYTDDLVNGGYPSDASGGQSGGGNSRLGTTFYYIRDAETREITRDFQPGDTILLEFYSDAMINLGRTNSLETIHPLTGAVLQEHSKIASAFAYGGLYSGFYRYTCTFTAPSDPLMYPFQVKMEDTYGTNLNILDNIRVSGATYPIIETYKLNEDTNTLMKTTNFNHTDRVYIKIITKDSDQDLSKVKAGVITISDFSGRYLIKSSPAVSSASPNPPSYQAPLSSLYKTSATSDSPSRTSDADTAGVYTVFIELKAADLSWWMPKKNSYTLSLSSLIDMGAPGQGETYYDLTTQLNVTAPLSLTDIVASIGTGTFSWSSSGAQWTNSQLVWFEKGVGSNAWGKTTIDSSAYDGPLGMTLADIDNDGIKDLLVAFQDPRASIAWYRCQDVNGKTWSETPNTIAPPFDAKLGKQADTANVVIDSWLGNDAYGSSNKGLENEDASLWSSRYTSFITKYGEEYISENELCVAMETGDFNGDGDLDIVASYAHVVVFSTASSKSNAENDPSSSQGMFFNRGVYVFWGDKSWQKVELGSTMDWTKTSSGILANGDNNPAVLDLAVGDFNKDGCDDIVGVTETGETYVWMSSWKEYVGSSDRYNKTFDARLPLPTVPGTTPWSHTQKIPRVEVAQMDTLGYLDIIRTSTGNNNIYVIHTTGTDGKITNTFPITEYGTDVGKATANVTHTLSGTEGGYLRDLIYADNNVATITEIYRESDTYTSRPGTYAGVSGPAYAVTTGKTLSAQQFMVGSGDLGKTIATAVLHVSYSADSSYDGVNEIMWSINGVDRSTTGIVPKTSQTGVEGSFDLRAAGVKLANGIGNLIISFEHGGSAGTVTIDDIWLEVTFVEGNYLNWMYEITNIPGRPFHNLDIVAKSNSASEKFIVTYSWDNTTWFPLGTIQGTEMTSYSYSLYYSSNSKYYLKIVDQNDSTPQSENCSLLIDMVRIGHSSPGVEWKSENIKTGIIPSSYLATGEYVTSIAIGDMGSNGASTAPGTSHAADGVNDIVVGTSMVGGSNLQTLFIHTVGSSGVIDSPLAINTAELAARAGSGGPYDVASIALGDFDADYDLDIVLTVGFAPGRGQDETPSIPTIWLYSNDPQAGSWTFDEAPLSALGADEAGINVVTGNVNLSLFFPFIGLAGMVVASISIERLARRKR